MRQFERGALLLGLMTLCGAVAAVEPAKSPIKLDIRSQPIGDALNEFARQSGLQVVIDPKEGGSITAPRVVGTYTPDAALTKLLADTGLRHEYLNNRTVAVRVAKANFPTASEGRVPETGEDSKESQRPLALARAQTQSPRTEQQSGQSETSDSQRDEAARQERVALDEVTVTGTRIRGRKEVAQPSWAVTREEIDQAGFNTVEELVEKLPQNFSIVTPLGRAAGNLVGNSVADANYTRVTAIDLRGLGPESTLTLINGRRRAGSVFGRVVDVSAIPLSAIERMDVVTGGASAIYGADAVAGVVNIITRRDFEGAESRISYGGPTGYGDGDIFKASHIQGFDFESGSLVAAYDYEQRWASNLVDAGGAMATRLPNGRRYTYRFLEADVERHSAYIAGRLMLGDSVELYGDAFYTDKGVKSQNQAFFSSSLVSGVRVEARLPSLVIDTAPAESYGGALGVKIDAGADWTVDIGGAYSYTNSRYTQFGDFRFVDPASDFWFLTDELYNKAMVSSSTAMADGSLPEIFGIRPRAALGIEFRKEEFTRREVTNQFSTATGAVQLSLRTPLDPPDRRIRSAFAELQLPLVEDGGPGVRRLEASFGARHDEYSDFGGAFNWTSGLIWQPATDLTFRGSYGTAMRAPSLFDASGGVFRIPARFALSFGHANGLPDPTQGGALVPVVGVAGNVLLAPEEAVSWSAGADYAPSFAPWAKLSVSWFSIEYDNRIGFPLALSQQPRWLTFESSLAPFTTRNPTPAQVQALLDARNVIPAGGYCCLADGTILPPNVTGQQILDALPGLVIIDNRQRNLLRESLQGLDFRFDADFDTDIGRLNLGVYAAKTLSHDRVATLAAPALSQLDQVGLPPSFRLRGNLGWSDGPWGAHIFVNYTPSYDNPFPAPTGGVGIAPGVYAPKVDSWTTVDLTLRFDASGMGNSALLDGVGVSLSVSNLFDTDLPFWSSTGSVGRTHDAANASPVGRFVTLNVTKRWRPPHK